MNRNKLILTQDRTLTEEEFIDLCERLQYNPCDELAWRGIFGDYLDTAICTVVIKEEINRRLWKKEFLAYT